MPGGNNLWPGDMIECTVDLQTVKDLGIIPQIVFRIGIMRIKGSQSVLVRPSHRADVNSLLTIRHVHSRLDARCRMQDAGYKMQN